MHALLQPPLSAFPPHPIRRQNFYLNAASHNVRPPSTLLPGQANITQAQYEAIILAQVTELWTENGDLTEIWLDGGCGDLLV